MGKKSSKAPDVTGAAETQGRYARETARDATYADRPDQHNPFGSVEWSQTAVQDPGAAARFGEMTDPGEYKGPNSGLASGLMRQLHAKKVAEYEKAGKAGMVTKWTQNQTLTPELQRTLDNTMGFMGDRSELAAGMTGRIQDEMGSAPDWQQFGDVEEFDPEERRQTAEDNSYQKSANRLDSRFGSRSNDLEIKLRNMGLRPGDQSYDAQMSTFGNERTDAYEQARLGATAEGRDEFGTMLQGNERSNALRSQQIQEYLAKRGFSLGEANALQEGQTANDLAAMATGG